MEAHLAPAKTRLRCLSSCGVWCRHHPDISLSKRPRLRCFGANGFGHDGKSLLDSQDSQPFRWQQVRAVNISFLSVDIVASALLVNLTGGIDSPFILYTLLPVLTAALLISLITGTYVLVGYIYNPASSYVPTLQAVNDFLVYVIALGLVATLPFIGIPVSTLAGFIIIGSIQVFTRIGSHPFLPSKPCQHEPIPHQ